VRRPLQQAERLDNFAIQLAQGLLISRFTRDGAGRGNAAAVKNVQRWVPVLMCLGENHLPIVNQRIDVKDFALDEPRE